MVEKEYSPNENRWCHLGFISHSVTHGYGSPLYLTELRESFYKVPYIMHSLRRAKHNQYTWCPECQIPIKPDWFKKKKVHSKSNIANTQIKIGRSCSYVVIESKIYSMSKMGRNVYCDRIIKKWKEIHIYLKKNNFKKHMAHTVLETFRDPTVALCWLVLGTASSLYRLAC